MVLTINIIGEEPNIINENATNVIVTFPMDYEHLFRNSLRGFPFRYLNTHDVYTDIYPSQRSKNVKGIKIVKTTNVSNGVQASVETTGQPNNISFYSGDVLVKIGDTFLFNDLGYKTHGGILHFKRENGLGKISYLYFNYINQDGTIDNETIKLAILSIGGFKYVYNIINYNASQFLPENTIVPLTLTEHNVFGFTKINGDLNQPLNISDIEQSEELGGITQLYPSLNLNKPQRIMFVKNHQGFSINDTNTNATQPDFPPEEVYGDKLKYMGEPVLYGQSMLIDKVNNGALLIDTQEMSPNKVFHIAIEGYASGGLFYDTNQ